jgi:O-antigen/teichoic acid export membrane protein
MIKNTIANYIGRFWSILSNFLFIPLYIHYLGLESYSVISFSLVITGVIAILDAGLTATLSREFALKTNDNGMKLSILSTLELCYLLIALLIILILFFFGDQIARNWLHLNSVDPIKVSYYLKIIGIGIAFQLIGNFYMGGLLGLEQQVKANLFQIGWGVIKNGLVVIPLIYLPSLELFFIWQTISTIIYVVLLRISLAKLLNSDSPLLRFPKFEKVILKRIWKFAGGMFLIAVVAGVNTQMDKLAISKLLPIDKLGYYTLAVSIAQGLVILVNPISTAILPRFTFLYSENKNLEATELFHKIFLLVSILIFSFAANIVFNGKIILWIWTGDMNLASEAYLFIPFLVIGMSMLSLQVIPYTIAIANGYTKLNNYLGLISLAITIPGYWIMVSLFGAIGAAITWAIIQVIITPVYLFYINKYFLYKRSILIFIKDSFLPLIISFLISLLLSQNKMFSDNRVYQLIWIGTSTLLTLLLCVIILLDKSEKHFLLKFLKLKS